MTHFIELQTAINAVKDIRMEIWMVDIPSPTVPEYIEHHRQMLHLMDVCDKKLAEWYSAMQGQVACLNCQHYDRHDKRCTVWNHGVWPEDFCSRAERRETDG